ncbi:RagB/SusD family nutrient uptake outer membrane protein [Chitinophaga parva]|uniref:RagB/SusD family nutrient uptake outer membrane protein n=1 Tax=Chitinophaga parva TaxID=2169414 RepID=A0A2T7BHL5_9BACT|nr:RagB/SusD family nutrient uptake outer membrane protein [Chitinophaga parva]PUZ25776.1 RagB/SusD family nutrient uptake outer membrane protein [Chitinophaga parva]
MRKIVYPLFYITAVFTLFSCKKSFLEVIPLGEQVAVTTHDYDQLMNDPAFYIDRYAGGWQDPELMGDEVAVEAPFINQYSKWSMLLFQWQAVIYKDGDMPPFALSHFLSELYTLNKIINEVMNSQDGTDADKARILAEAKATRAWTYFQLVNYYAKPYAAATAGTDPGFPIITKADVNGGPYARGTVQETYDFIIKDFTDAITSLPVKAVIQTRMSKPAAEGLLGKVYLFMGRNADALQMFNAAFTDLAANSSVRLYDYNQEFAAGGVFQPIDPTYGPQGPGKNYNDLTEAVVSKIFPNTSYNGNGLCNDGLVLTPATQALFRAGDLRLLLYTNKNPDGSPNAGGRLRKYGVQYSRYGLQLSELYLLRAEAEARANDLAGAKTDLEVLRSHRMPAADATVPAATAGNQNALIKFVIDERIREFALEGYRWFDMRRLSVDPLFAGMVFTHVQYNADGTTTEYHMDQPNRLTLRLPPNIINGNTGMENNP